MWFILSSFSIYFFFPSALRCKIQGNLCHFSGTIRLRILKVCTNIEFNLFSVRENQYSPVYHFLYLSIFLSFSQKSVTDFSPAIRVRVFKFCIHPKNFDMFCKRNKDAELYFFCLSLPCNTKGNLHLQSCFNIPLIAMAGGMRTLLTICYTVKPVLSKHLWEAKNWLLKTGACLIQVDFHLFAFNGT